eukprot:8855863-Alexandrium_andersonii.AAC.1
MSASLVGSEMCIRDRSWPHLQLNDRYLALCAPALAAVIGTVHSRPVSRVLLVSIVGMAC